MKADTLDTGNPETDTLRLTFDLAEAEALAEAIIHHNSDNMPSALLELASLLRQANYEAHDDFRQPPHAWEPGRQHPSV